MHQAKAKELHLVNPENQGRGPLTWGQETCHLVPCLGDAQGVVGIKKRCSILNENLFPDVPGFSTHLSHSLHLVPVVGHFPAARQIRARHTFWGQSINSGKPPGMGFQQVPAAPLGTKVHYMWLLCQCCAPKSYYSWPCCTHLTCLGSSCKSAHQLFSKCQLYCDSVREGCTTEKSERDKVKQKAGFERVISSIHGRCFATVLLEQPILAES